MPDLPEREFAPNLRRDYPSIVKFLDEFLETCLANDYTGYRTMVTRCVDPEPRDRFEGIYHAISKVFIESIQKIEPSRPVPELCDLKDPFYLVIARITLKQRAESDDASIAPRRPRPRERRVAIVVFEEDGDWRMAPAPAAYQPRADRADDRSAQTQPTSKVSYPWDEFGDD